MSYKWSNDDIRDLEILPIEEAETIPARWFTSPELHEIDKELLLAASWLYVGHESQVPTPGDYLVDSVLDRPILVLRNMNNEIVCLSNVCRHRGGPLATKSGTARVLRCAYHAWSYNLDGQLLGAPKFDGVKNFDQSRCQLPRYRLENMDGFLFVNFSGDALPLTEHLSGISEAIHPIDLRAMRFQKRVVYEVKSNWKVYIDNYMEGYHIRSVHPKLANILDVSGYKTILDGNKVLQFGPLAGADNPYHTDGAAYYYQVFPNLMLNILPGRVQINSILPIDADRCLTVFDLYLSETNPEKLAQKLRDDIEVSDLVQQEDIEICERVQEGLKSKAYNKGRICVREEMGVWAFQNNLRSAYKNIIGRQT
jgi:choline monooxygenase